MKMSSSYFILRTELKLFQPNLSQILSDKNNFFRAEQNVRKAMYANYSKTEQKSEYMFAIIFCKFKSHVDYQILEFSMGCSNPCLLVASSYSYISVHASPYFSFIANLFFITFNWSIS